jgi:hypothetical protein
MGASGWTYTVAYQSDVTKVLDDLRRDVFLRGEYERPAPDVNFLEELGFFDVDDETREALIGECGLEPLRAPLARVGLDGLRDYIRFLYDAPKLRDLDELMALQCISTEGTHSILDIVGVGQTPADGSIFPLPVDFLQRYFGTAEPTRAAVEESRARDVVLDEAYERGQGIYFTLYQDGRPEAIYIEGASGD